ncbi:uncharacterized protein LOC135212082 isoform X3 [Macrobrachium nipponense]|uniref:uncharacterized protein LOC135212082 isoform X3 n=1 Tax=Macrobrachium nipponense TaxID=159736 RepID=UPI0030C8B3AC
MATNLMKTSDDDDEKREVSLKRGNMDSSGSDHEPGKSSEDASDPVPERRTSARILKLKEKSELEKAMPPSPATKKRRKFGTRFKGKYERVGSEGDREESSQKEKLTLDGKSGELNKRNSEVPDMEADINGPTSADDLQDPKKLFTVQVKRVVQGVRDGELEVVTTYEEHGGTIDAAERGYIIKNNSSPGKVTRTCKFLDPGPIRRVNAPTEGKKYMILNKATIQGMMEKGLIQAIGKDGSDQQNVAFAYRAVLPKTGPTVLRRVPNPNFQGISPHTFIHGKSVGTSLSQDSGTLPATATSASTKLPSSTAPTTGLSSSVTSTSTALDVSSGGLNVQIPTLASAKNSTTGTNPVVTAPVYVKSPIFGSNLSSEKMPVITVPTSVLNHIQKNASLFSVAVTSSSSVATPGQSLISTPKEQSLKSTPKESLIVTSVGKTIKSSEDLDNPDKAADISENENDDADNAKTYGVPTGVCKVLKSMKMYQYINKSEGKSATHLPVKGSQSIRWVAVPNDPNNPEGKSGPQLQLGTPPVLPIVAAIGNDPNRRNLPDTNNILGTPSKKGLRKYVKEMKLQHARLIGKHRTRYSRLQKKYSELERDFKDVEDVGTPQQIVRDCKKYLSEEHAVFMESQMFWKNVDGKGNRYSKRFLQIMLALYCKSPAGYKYLKTVFTLPSIKLLLKLQSQGFGNIEGTSKVDPLEVGKIQAPDGLVSKCEDGQLGSSNVIKSEVPILSGKDPMDLPPDNKDWFKSGILSETLPSTSGQTVFFSNSNKGTLLSEKRPDEGEEEEEEEEEVEEEGDDDSSRHTNSDNLELGEVGSSITTFDNIAKKVVVVPDNENLNKQEISIQWEDAWSSL